MKLLSTTLALCGILSTSAFVTLNSSTKKDLVFSAADEQAIRKVIEGETTAYFNRDSIRLISYYVDEDITQTVWNSPNGSYGIYKGLRSMRKNFHEAFVKHPDIQPQPNIQRGEWFFKPFSNEWVWVNYVQKTQGPGAKPYTNYETRIVRKVNEQWKLAVMYSLGDHGLGMN